MVIYFYCYFFFISLKVCLNHFHHYFHPLSRVTSRHGIVTPRTWPEYLRRGLIIRIHTSKRSRRFGDPETT